MSITDRHLWEGKYVDLFTIVHVLTGMCFSFSVFFYGSPFIESFIAFVIFTIIWEIIEFVTDSGETIQNQIVDVLTGALGFLIGYTIVPTLASSLANKIICFTLLYIIVWTFAHYGFQSFALHADRDIKKYKKSPSSAVLLYVVIIAAIFLF
ncbi:MAG: hypothetical protein WAX80_01660 [Minisyncoccia bacterium]